MKKFIKTLCALLAGLSAISCQHDENTPEPELKPLTESITAESTGGHYEILYSLINPIEGMEAKASCMEDWIKNFTYSDGTIGFDIQENTSDTNRTAMISVIYADLGFDVSVTQYGTAHTAGQNAFEIRIDKTELTAITVSVIPEDKEQTYAIMLTTKERYESLGSDEANYKDDMEYYTSLAQENGMTLREWLEENVLEQGDVENVIIDMLDPGTEYYVYVYGLTADAVRTTDITDTLVSTLAVDKTGCTFNFEIKVNGAVADIKAIPSDETLPYYVDVVSESYLSLAEKSIEEYMDGAFETELFYEQYIEGKSFEEAMDFLTKQGTTSAEYPVTAGNWYVFAHTVHPEAGVINSDFSYEPFSVEGKELSECFLKIEILNEGVTSVDLNITATKNDSYGVKIFPKEEIDGKTSDEITDYIMEKLNFQYMEGGSTTMMLNGLQPETEYCAVGFGFDLDLYAITTFPTVADFKTISYQEFSSISFAVTPLNMGRTTAQVSLTVEPENAIYLYGLADEHATADEILAGIEEDFEYDLYWGDVKDKAEYIRKNARSGSFTHTFTSLSEESGYRIYAIGADYMTGNYVGDLFLSEPFYTTGPETAEDLHVELIYDKYFSGDELAETYPDEFMGAQGYLIVPVELKITGSDEASKHYYHFHTGNQMDADESYLRDFLVNYGKTGDGSNFAVIADNEYTMIAYAETADGKVSEVFRQLVTFTAEGVSPVDEFSSVEQAVHKAVFHPKEHKEERIIIEMGAGNIARDTYRKSDLIR